MPLSKRGSSTRRRDARRSAKDGTPGRHARGGRDALGTPLTWTGGGGGTLAGAAALAGLGIGQLRDPSATRQWREATHALVRHVPNRHAHAKFEALFARRLALYDALRSTF